MDTDGIEMVKRKKTITSRWSDGFDLIFDDQDTKTLGSRAEFRSLARW
jgi:hypothetical protein